MSTESLIARRRAAMGPAYRLFYDEPLHLVRGEGVWLWDADGNRYLDCYNNVASVGHGHADVVRAVHRQMQLLNTHTRYLHENVVLLAERLGALLPGDLGTCMFVCTGTEANDLAVQIARTVTGRRGIVVTEASYHGNSTLVRTLSTDSYPASERPGWLAVVEPPDFYRGPYRAEDPDAVSRYVDGVASAIRQLERSGYGTAALMLDPIWDAPGPLAPPAGYVHAICDLVHGAGGMVVADEVQSGHCRTGTWWGLEHYGIRPDIVTMGKPAGNGYPLGVTVTTPEIAAEFAAGSTYFNTFGGNPVSASAGLAVLEVMAREKLAENAALTGSYLRRGLETLAASVPRIGNVEGRGLFLGLDLVDDPVTRRPVTRDAMHRVTSRLRHEGILVGATGRHGNVLKLRPPLVFRPEHADMAVAAIAKVLGED